MANGLQIAASGLIAQEWHLDAVANDIANVNTVGYRQSRAAFSEVLGTSGGVRASSLGTSSDPGALAASDNPLSIALDGPGFIQVRSTDGTTALSRGGDLHIAGRKPAATSSPAPRLSLPRSASPTTPTTATPGRSHARSGRASRSTSTSRATPFSATPRTA